MGVIVLIAAALAGALLAAGLDPSLVRPSLAAIAALLGLTALVPPRARRALTALYRLHAPALLLFAVLLAVLILAATGLSADAAWHARHAALHLFSLVLLAGAVASAAAAHGRTMAVTGLLIAAVSAALLVLVGASMEVDTAFGRVPPLVSEPSLAAAYGLVAILSIFAASDELRRRPAAGGRALPPLARRLFVPVAGLMTAFGMLLLSGSASALAATAVGGVAFAAALSLRARKSRVGMALVPAVAGISAIAATLAALATGAGGGLGWVGAGAQSRAAFEPAAEALALVSDRPLLGHGLESTVNNGAPTAFRWLAETGWLGVALIAIAILLIGFNLAVRHDRGRPFSRGFILFTGLAAFGLTEALLSPSLDQPAAGFTLACFVGVAFSYLDFEATSRARKSSPVSS